MKYFGSWSDRDGCARDWYDGRWKDGFTIPDDFPTDAEILFASYGGGSYDGDALVIFERDGKLYENHGGHCSCYGLEDQWGPEETSWQALAMRDRDITLHDHEAEARDAFWALVDARMAVTK